MRVLEVRNLSVSVGRKRILRDVSFHLNKGDINVLFGPNGAGKSSLVHAIMGMPGYGVEGEISINGTDVSKFSIDKRVKQGLGIIYQNPPEVKGVSLRDILKICAGRPKGKLNREELELVRDLGMDRFLDREVNVGFSGGEKKRSEILQLLMMKPGILFLDEPDSGVDVQSMRLIGKKIMDYCRKSRAAALIITHQGYILEEVEGNGAYVLMGGSLYCYKKNPKKILKDIMKHGYEGCIRCQERGKIPE